MWISKYGHKFYGSCVFRLATVGLLVVDSGLDDVLCGPLSEGSRVTLPCLSSITLRWPSAHTQAHCLPCTLREPITNKQVLASTNQDRVQSFRGTSGRAGVQQNIIKRLVCAEFSPHLILDYYHVYSSVVSFM